MSKERPSNNQNSSPKSDIERIARFMDGFIGFEMLDDIPCPDDLQCDYDDLDENGKKRWYEYTFSAVLRDATMQAVGMLGRSLRKVEITLIQRRIENYFMESGIEY